MYRNTGAYHSLVVEKSLQNISHSHTGKSVVISTVGGVCRSVVISTVGGVCRTVVISTVGGVCRTV